MNLVLCCTEYSSYYTLYNTEATYYYSEYFRLLFVSPDPVTVFLVLHEMNRVSLVNIAGNLYVRLLAIFIPKVCTQ